MKLVRLWVRRAMGFLAPLAALVLITCGAPNKTAQPLQTPRPTGTPAEIHGVTGTWIFDGPLQLQMQVRQLPYAPGNYSLKPGNQLYQALMETHDLYEKRNLRLSGRFEIKAGSRVLDASDEIRGFIGNSIIGKTFMVKPYHNAHFSVLFQFKKDVTPTQFRAVFRDAGIRPITVPIK